MNKNQEPQRTKGTAQAVVDCYLVRIWSLLEG